MRLSHAAHGTSARYRWERRHLEHPCPQCLAAENRRTQDRTRNARAGGLKKHEKQRPSEIFDMDHAIAGLHRLLDEENR